MQVLAHLFHLLPILLKSLLILLILPCEVVVGQHGSWDCNVLVEPCVRLHEVEITLLDVVKHADLHCMEEVGLREVAHNTGNKLKQVESSVTKVL